MKYLLTARDWIAKAYSWSVAAIANHPHTAFWTIVALAVAAIIF